MSLYRVLDNPPIYTAAQLMFAPGAVDRLTRQIAALAERLPKDGPVLDVGCGPQSWLWRIGLQPVGLDVEPAYVDAYIRAGGRAMVGSADAIPYGDTSFAGVWSIGVMHHLPDEVVTNAIREAIRVCRPGGYVAILDAVLPASVLRRPVAAFIRRLDRGQHMRREAALRALLDPFGPWTYTRFTYAGTGLEMLACVYRTCERAAERLRVGAQFGDLGAGDLPRL
jgi:SAM-dependent methyltransferase